MSGPKAADVRPKLRRAVEEIEKLINNARRNTKRLDQLSSVNLDSSIRKANELQSEIASGTVTEAMLKYTPEDSSLLQSQREEIDRQLMRGRKEQDLAEQLQQEASQLRAEAETLLNSAVKAANSAARGMAESINGWYLDEEQRQANLARRKAQNALSLEQEAAEKLRQALDHKKKAKNAFDSAANTGKKYQKFYSSILETAKERETAAKIKEENQRLTVSSKANIDSLTARIQDLNHEKFAPGEYAKLLHSLQEFQQNFEAGNYAQTATTGPGIAAQLQTLEQTVSKRQNEFESAQLSARNNWEAAREEISVLDPDQLIRWTGEKEAVTNAFQAFDQAAELIQQESFAAAEELTASSLASIRTFAGTAEKRAAAANQRMELAEVIMNALYEQGYDTPTFYYAQQNQAGEDVEFSDLTIFAKAPGTRGDMRMNIDLEGKVKLEVEGIAEGEESVCHKLISDLQAGVGNEIDFTMTDWGRAAGVDSDARIAIKQQMKEQEKIRERQHG